MANKGSINYCVRWESDAPVSTTLRDQIHAALKKQFAKWMAAQVENGRAYNNWPYTTVPVNVVGWAVKNRSTLQWTDNSVDIYSGVLDGAGCPAVRPRLRPLLPPGRQLLQVPRRHRPPLRPVPLAHQGLPGRRRMATGASASARSTSPAS